MTGSRAIRGGLARLTCPAAPLGVRRSVVVPCRGADHLPRAYCPSMLRNVREYIDRLQIDGHTIGEDHDDDPVLMDPDGRAVDTWRENYPYEQRLTVKSTTSRSTCSRWNC